LDYSLLSSVTNNKYIDIDSDSDSYGIEPTVFDSNTNSDTDSNANCDVNSGINYDANSITRFDDAYEAFA